MCNCKYLGFHLKPCIYLRKELDWLIAKVEKMTMNQSFRWLSKGGKLTLVKYVIEEMPVYWMHLWIQVGIIDNIMKLCFKLLWSGNRDSSSLPWNS